MRIINKTKWDTGPLKKIIARVAKDELKPEHAKSVTVTIVTGRHSGHANIGPWGQRMWVRVPSPARLDKPDPVEIAFVCGHEMAHLRGLRHGADMNCARYARHVKDPDGTPSYTRFYAWAKEPEWALALKAPRVKPKKDRAGHAAAMLALWQRRSKRTQTMLKKWARKVRYYEHRQTEAASRALDSPHPTTL